MHQDASSAADGACAKGPRIIIVGSGISGILFGLKLRERGWTDFTILENAAADVMIVFTLTTMRYFAPFDLAPYSAIRAYLQVIAQRLAYRRAMEKGDPDLALLLT